MVSESDNFIGTLTYREWHGFVNGFYAGARWGARKHEYDREKHYWRGGYLVGTALRYSIILYLYKKIQDND